MARSPADGTRTAQSRRGKAKHSAGREHRHPTNTWRWILGAVAAGVRGRGSPRVVESVCLEPVGFQGSRYM